MAHRYFLHPFSVKAFFDKDLFNKPSSRWCNFCLRPCMHEPPKSLPRLKTDAYSTSYESSRRFAGVFDARKLFCDFHCMQAYLTDREESTVLFRDMLTLCYRLPADILIRKALPRWTVQAYGGVLTWEEWHAWKHTGCCVKGDVPYNSPNSQDAEEEETRYRTAVLSLAIQNPYYDTIFNPKDPRWIKGCSKSDGLLCYNDGHLIDGPCFTACVSDRAPAGTKTFVDPAQHGTEIEYTQRLLFCSPGCVIKEIHRASGAHRTLRLYWTHQLLQRYWAGGQHLTIVPAPCRQLLTEFFGPMEIDNWRSDTPRFKLIRCAPIAHDFPKLARLDEDLYEINEEVVCWNRTHASMPEQLDASIEGFNPLLHQTRRLYFPKLCHHIDLSKHARDSLAAFRRPIHISSTSEENNSLYAISLQLLTIEVEEELASNQDILNSIIDDSQPTQPTFDSFMLA